MSLQSSLVVRSFRFKRWVHDGELWCFTRDTMDGLMDLRPGYRVIAINNNAPHNGQFTSCIEAIESAAQENAVRFDVVQIWNDRLAEWFERRGYSVAGRTAYEKTELGRHAVYPTCLLSRAQGALPSATPQNEIRS